MRYHVLLASAFLAFILLFTPSNAQTAASDYASGSLGHCGTPALRGTSYQQILANTRATAPGIFSAMKHAKSEASLNSVSPYLTFFVINQEAQRLDTVRAKLVFDGRMARVWVDINDTGRAAVMNRIPYIARALDTATSSISRDSTKGIIANDIDLFGTPPTQFAVEGKSDFLLFNIPDQNVLGYFSPYDQSLDTGSNQRNMLYIDDREGLSSLTSLLNTIAHEFQHLIHHGRVPESDTFLDEGASETAGLACGYPDRTNEDYLRNTNVAFYYWTGVEATMLADYERAFTYVHYMYEQFGDKFLYALDSTSNWGAAGITEALKFSGLPPASADWSLSLRNFAVANLLQKDSADGRYGYLEKVTGTAQPQAKMTRSYTLANLKLLDTVVLQSYAAAYFQYTSPGALKIRFSGKSNFHVMAIGYHGAVPEVTDLVGATDYTLGEGNPYDKVVLAVLNMAGSSQNITWKINGGVSGIDENELASASAAISMAPNPVHDIASLTYTTTATQPVRIQLYNEQGALVGTPLENGIVNAGTHTLPIDFSALAPGAYAVRITRGEATSVRWVVLAR